MKRIERLIVILIVVTACVGCDQLTKSAARSVLPHTGPLSYLGDTVRFQLAYNDGAFFRLGSSLPAPWRRTIFVFGVGAFLLGILAYSMLSTSPHRMHILAAAFLFAGGLGNLIDRLLYSGAVVDFINIGVGNLRTGIFNVADIAITAAVIVIFVSGVHDNNLR